MMQMVWENLYNTYSDISTCYQMYRSELNLAMYQTLVPVHFMLKPTLFFHKLVMTFLAGYNWNEYEFS